MSVLSKFWQGFAPSVGAEAMDDDGWKWERTNALPDSAFAEKGHCR